MIMEALGTYCLQFYSNALRVSAYCCHSSTECLPDGAVPLQSTLATTLQSPQTLTQRGQGDSGGEHGLQHSSGEGRKRNYQSQCCNTWWSHYYHNCTQSCLEH